MKKGYRQIGKDGTPIATTGFNAPLYTILALFAVIVVAAVLIPVIILTGGGSSPPTTTTTATSTTTIATTAAATTTTTTITTTAAPTTTTTTNTVPTTSTTATTTVPTTSIGATTTTTTTVPTTTTTTTNPTTTTTTTTTTTPAPTTSIPPLHELVIDEVKTIGYQPQIQNGGYFCPIVAADIDGTTSSTPAWLYSTYSMSNTGFLASQTTDADTPALYNICPAEMVYSSLTVSVACPTRNLFLGAATSGRLTGYAFLRSTVALLNAPYRKPYAQYYPTPPNNTALKQAYADYFWYCPILYNCAVVNGSDICVTLVSSSVIPWAPNSGVEGQYPLIGAAYLLSDAGINPFNLTDVTIDGVVARVVAYFNGVTQPVGIKYSKLGGRSITRGCIEMSTNQVDIVPPNVTRSIKHEQQQHESLFHCRDNVPGCTPLGHLQTNLLGEYSIMHKHFKPPSKGKRARLPRISAVTTNGFSQNGTVISMVIIHSYSSVVTDRLFGYMQPQNTISRDNYHTIAQQTQYFSPLLDQVSCNTDLTFVRMESWSLYNPSEQISGYLTERSPPYYSNFSYALANLLFVPDAGPYNVTSGEAAAVASASVYYFTYLPRWHPPAGSCACDNGITQCTFNGAINYTWCIDAGAICGNPAKFIQYDPKFGSTTGFCFTNLAAYQQWVVGVFTGADIVSAKLSTILNGAIEMATNVNPVGVYNSTEPNPPTVPPSPGNTCLQPVPDCTQVGGPTLPYLVDSGMRCTYGDEYVMCLYDPGTDTSTIVDTEIPCQCL